MFIQHTLILRNPFGLLSCLVSSAVHYSQQQKIIVKVATVRQFMAALYYVRSCLLFFVLHAARCVGQEAIWQATEHK